MNIELSKNSVANRRLYVQNVKTLIDFSEENITRRIKNRVNVGRVATEPLKKDIITIGDKALRIKADRVNGRYAHDMSVSYKFPKAVNLTDSATLFFAISPYDGPLDSQYFKNLSENMYFVDKPDPLLVSHNYVSVTLSNGKCSATRTVKLVNYGFNKVFMNFAGEDVLKNVREISFRNIVDEDVPGWQGVVKIDTVKAGMETDFFFNGGGLEKLFSAENATVKHSDSVVTLKCKAGGKVTFPSLKNAKDTICDVWLPVKNTLLFAMSSNVATNSFTVCWKNDLSDKEYSKTFAKKDLKRLQAFYFNLSDSDGCKGRLTEFSIIPEKACTLTLRKISFEQEFIIRESAGEFKSCVADYKKKTVSLKASIKPEYACGKLEIYDVYMSDVHYEYKDLLKIGEFDVPASGKFTAVVPLMREKVTRLASQFLGVIVKDGKRTELKERVIIENWQECCEANPHPFELSDKVFDVTDFGAKGDGYTDDTDAIQAAIDAAAENGGIVVLPCNTDCPYGQRYVATNITFRSNIEFHIEKNTVLWQADNPSYYKRMMRFGHNIPMTGINWPANHSSGNYPLCYGFRIKNFKLTGPGTIRMCDTESASDDGLFTTIGDNVCIGCCDRMHVVPVGIFGSMNLEVKNINIIRASAPHFIINCNENGYFANVVMDQAKCTGADGMWPCGSNGMVFTRILLNSNDDGLCLSSNYNDPRDFLWVHAYPGFYHGTKNVTLSHSRFQCHIFTASAISFCTWGTNAPELDKQEVSGIKVYDTTLQGRVVMGGWTDNPYFGKQPFDGSELDDFSPVKDVTVYDCDFKSPVGIAPLRITNFDNDFGFKSPSNFEYGDFKRRAAERLPYWTLGLSNWSFHTPDAVKQILFYGKECAAIRPIIDEINDLYQGLYIEKGNHTMTFNYKVSGAFKAFIADKNGNVLFEKEFEQPGNAVKEGKPWIKAELPFSIKEEGLYRLGIIADDQKTVIVYATDFNVD